MTDEQQALWDQIQKEKQHFNPDRFKMARLARKLADLDSGPCDWRGGRMNDIRPGAKSTANVEWGESGGQYR